MVSGREDDKRRLPHGYSFWASHRSSVQPAADVIIWAVSLLSAGLLRYGRTVPDHFWGDAFLVIGLAAAGQIVAGFATSLYRVRWQVGSFEEIAALARVVIGVTVLLLFVSLLFSSHPLPVSSIAAGGTLALILAAGIRSAWRLNHERYRRPTDHAERAIVFGAGQGGTQLLNSLLTDPDSPYAPVALLDDDPLKRNMRVRSLRVSGTRHDLRSEANRLAADTVIIAIPSAESELIREISDLAIEVGLTVKVLPPVSRFLNFPGNSVEASDVRPVSDADLLGRHMVDTKIDSIAGYLTGRRVLVTGAGGSIGSELCRQIARFAPSQLIMLDRDESGLHEVQLSLEGRALLDDRSLVVCDIRDRAALMSVFAEHRPDVVFHAAALKHLPLLEMWPAEAVKTNVFGTQNVLDASASVSVAHLVNISTDKAANPCSVLGYTKRLAERLTAGMSRQYDAEYLSVRFGNVLGSRGSVLRSFRAQIDAGGPLTVTDPEVSRYFMMVEEAVQLVIQAGAVGRSGEVLVLDMGKPIRIAEVADRLVRESRRAIEVVYTGLRPGEKLEEDLFGDGEADERPIHPLISHVAVPPLQTSDVTSLTAVVDHDPGHISEALRRHCSKQSLLSSDTASQRYS